MNDLNFTQSATILNAVYKQATGKNSIAPVDSKSFVSMATETLLSGNNVMEALSQVLTRTFFSVRPYSRKLKGIKRDTQKWGNHVRKITILDRDVVDNAEYSLVDGQSVDHYTVRKPEVLQTNFYDADTYSDFVTRFKNQLDTAFTGPEEFGAFVSAVLQEMSDKFEKYFEESDRLLLANLIAGKTIADSASVFNLLTEYYNETGIYLVTDKDDTRYYKNKANYDDFSKWVASFIQTKSELMTERSLKFHMNFTGKDIPRHTPKEYQHLYLYTPEINGVRTRVLSSAFNPEMLNVGDFEELNYFQSINTPNQIQVKPNYVNASGEVVNSSDTVTVSDIFGVLFDDDTIGSTIINTWSATTPLNANGGFWNMFYHWTIRYYEDLTENCCVFLMKQTASDPTVMNIAPTTLSIAKGATGTISVNYPQGEVTATSSAQATGITVAYNNGVVTVTVAADASATSSTITITDGTTTLTCAVTVPEAKNRSK